MPVRLRPAAARRPRGRAGVLRCALGLLAGLVGATAAAAEPFVPPETVAALGEVARIEDRGSRIEADFTSFPWSSAGTPPLATLLPEPTPQRSRYARTFPRGSVGTSPEIDLSILDPRPSILASPIAPPTPEAFPVLRGQSPDVTLLPLARGEASVQKTSLLGAITGATGRVRADWLTDFAETERVGVNALTSTWLGFGVDVEANYWERAATATRDGDLATGDLNVIYNFPFHPRVKFRSGVGGSWVADDGEFDAGWNLTHAVDVYLLWRFMATGEMDYGKIDDRKLFRYRLALGLTWGPAEFFSGYESYKLGGETLDGWVNGIALWY